MAFSHVYVGRKIFPERPSRSNFKNSDSPPEAGSFNIRGKRYTRRCALPVIMFSCSENCSKIVQGFFSFLRCAGPHPAYFFSKTPSAFREAADAILRASLLLRRGLRKASRRLYPKGGALRGAKCSFFFREKIFSESRFGSEGK